MKDSSFWSDTVPRAMSIYAMVIFVVLWTGFATALAVNQEWLDILWNWVRDLPIVLEILVWVLFLPIIVGLWIWESSWPALLRLLGFAGIVAWLYDVGPAGYETWLEWQLADGVRLLMLGHPGVAESSRLLRSFGLAQTDIAYPCRVIEHDRVYGFETHNDVTAEPLTDLESKAATNTVHVRATGQRGQFITPVVTGPWGGMALDPWLRSKNKLTADRVISDLQQTVNR